MAFGQENFTCINYKFKVNVRSINLLSNAPKTDHCLQKQRDNLRATKFSSHAFHSILPPFLFILLDTSPHIVASHHCCPQIVFFSRLSSSSILPIFPFTETSDFLLSDERSLLEERRAINSVRGSFLSCVASTSNRGFHRLCRWPISRAFHPSRTSSFRQPAISRGYERNVQNSWHPSNYQNRY